MRFAVRALVYLALPSVAFAWLLQVDFPMLVPRPFDSGFFDSPPDTLDRLVEALQYAALGAGLVVVLGAIVLVLSVGSGHRPRQSIKR